MSDQTMNSSIVPVNNPSIVKISKSHFSSRAKRVNVTWPVITICCGTIIGGVVPMLIARSRRHRTSALPLDQEPVEQDDKRIVTKESGGGGPIPNIVSMAKWFLGSFLMVIPFYKNFLKLEDTIEKSAKTVLNAVEKVAETVDEVAESVENSLPENSSLKKIVQTVEKLAEEVDKDTEVLESIVEKVDDMVDKLDAIVEPIIEDTKKI